MSGNTGANPPATYIKQILADHLPVKGLSIPGMPVGAPGMAGTAAGPLNVYVLGTGSAPKVFATF
ncbi:DUF411 domain-containing protein [uncultured Castellaniella sp.]|uniref:DUF411 domain-containing protein n=1 Tax=uncultured Castellaniella sp. TaxID=647907 RepID=UPI0034416860